jgi:mannose-6-phosphate isomerase-like protein (cupin superfamily)
MLRVRVVESAMQPGVLKCDPGREIPTAERCSILELVSASDDCLSIAQARVGPGTTTVWHRLHAVDERYVVLAGRGRVEVGREPAQEVERGDVVLIPAGTPQRIQNIGRDDLVFLCVCTPGFTQECYEDLERALR